MSHFPADNEDGLHGTSPAIQVQSLGPAILTPAQEIGNIVDRGNEIVTDHREWLAKFSQLAGPADNESPSISQPSTSLITPPPWLDRRAALPAPIPQLVPSALCDCNPQISAVSASFLASFSRISLTADQSAQSAAQSVVVALSIEQSISSAALISEARAMSSVSAASISAAASASSAIQSAINSANSAVAAAQASAAAAVSSANSLAADAKATATFVAAQAQATISQVNVQASASVLASRVASMTETRFALALTFSIIGSSIVSVLAYFLLLRYRQRRKLAKNKEEDLPIGSTRSSNGPSLSEFPHPRKSEWSFVRDAKPQLLREPHPGTEVILPDEPPQTLSSDPIPTAKQDREESMQEKVREWERPRPLLERKNTLIYDAERPDQPPKFKSLLMESLRTVSPFGSRRSKDLKVTGEDRKRLNTWRLSRKVLDDEGSEIGTAL